MGAAGGDAQTQRGRLPLHDRECDGRGGRQCRHPSLRCSRWILFLRHCCRISREHRRNGYAAEAITLVLRYYFQELRYQQGDGERLQRQRSLCSSPRVS